MAHVLNAHLIQPLHVLGVGDAECSTVTDALNDQLPTGLSEKTKAVIADAVFAVTVSKKVQLGLTQG